MTNRDRDSVAKLLRQVAERLASAPEATRESSERHQPGGSAAHQAGALEQVCRNEAHAIESLISSYLAPAKSRARGKR